MTATYSNTLRDDNERPIAGAQVYVYDQTGETLQALTDPVSGAALANPVVTDEFGNFSFNTADDGVKLLDIFLNTHRIWKETVLAGTFVITAAAGSSVSNRALLAAIAAPVANQSAILTEAGYEGLFVFSAANLSAQVAADPQQGIYVAPSTDLTGASGAWVRKLDSTLSIGLFTNAANLFITEGISTVHTSGHASVGSGAARYVYDATINAAYVTAHPYSSFVTANGRGFRISETLPTSLQYGAVADGVTDQSARLLALVAENAGGYVVIVPGTSATPLISKRVLFGATHAGTTIFFDNGTIKGPAGDSSIFYVGNAATGMSFYGNNTVLDSTASSRTSSTFYLSGAQDCIIHGLEISGAGSLKDCIYVGGEDAVGGLPSRRVQILHCNLHGATRNNISVVEGHDIEIAHCNIWGTTLGVVGAGIDVEANRWDVNGNPTTSNVWIHHNDIHDNATYGVVATFADGVRAKNNRAWNNPSGDFATGAGGAEFTQGVARQDKDKVAVTGFNTATGGVQVTAAVGANITLGTIVIMLIRNGSGATLPAEFTVFTYWMVMAKNAANTELTLSGNTITNVTSLAGTGTGTLTTDPNTSDIFLNLYQTGQCSNIEIIDNDCLLDAGTVAAHSRILVQTAVNCTVSNNRVYQHGNMAAIKFAYSRDVESEDNIVVGDPTAINIAGIIGTQCSGVRSRRNYVEKVPASGFDYSQIRDFAASGDRTYNCGVSTAAMGSYRIQNAINPFVEDVRMDGDSATTYLGFKATVGVTDGVFRKIDATGRDTSDANSIVVSASSRVMNSKVKGGTFYGSGTASASTWGSLAANSSGPAVTVVCPGAAVGKQVNASLSSYFAGLFLDATCSAGNVVTVTPRNTTGSVINASAATIQVQVV
jgi:hypothetical protein